jgi:hypothetical protein
MRRLNHTDIVCTITNGEQDGFLILLDEFDNKRLLKRRYAT